MAETRAAFWMRQWETKIRPGLLWSYLRDTVSVGGAIFLGLGPHVDADLNPYP